MYTSHPHAHMSGAPVFGPGAFNFRDLSMKRSKPDYFSMRPVRGSSPTASLAADLSQNFHIDMRYVWNCYSTLPASLINLPVLNCQPHVGRYSHRIFLEQLMVGVNLQNIHTQ
jgi:hypothetical protein